VEYLWLSRAGVVLSQLRIGLFQNRFQVGQTPGFHCSRHRRSELDGCRLIPEYPGPIRFGTITDDYREVFAAFERRGRALPASNWSISKSFSSGSVKLRIS
jgi:hypothetical protein